MLILTGLTINKPQYIICRKGVKHLYDIILFDFDGTIYDTLEGITKSMQYALKKQGMEVELNELTRFAGPPLLDMLQETYGFSVEKSQEVVADFRERYQPVGIYESRVFPGIPEFLRKLNKAGKRLGIATSKPQALAEKLLDESGIKDCFEHICGSQPDGSLSHKAEVLQEVLRQFEIKDESVVLIGDTKFDVIGAHKCGLPCIGVRYGYAAEGELEEAGAETIAQNLDELLNLLIS